MVEIEEEEAEVERVNAVVGVGRVTTGDHEGEDEGGIEARLERDLPKSAGAAGAVDSVLLWIAVIAAVGWGGDHEIHQGGCVERDSADVGVAELCRCGPLRAERAEVAEAAHACTVDVVVKAEVQRHVVERERTLTDITAHRNGRACRRGWSRTLARRRARIGRGGW